MAVQVKALQQKVQQALTNSSQESHHQPQQQGSQQHPHTSKQDPLRHIPKELLMHPISSQCIPSPDGRDENLLLLLHGLGDKPVRCEAHTQHRDL